MSGGPVRPAWLSVGLGLVVGLLLAAAIIGGVVFVVATGQHGGATLPSAQAGAAGQSASAVAATATGGSGSQASTAASSASAAPGSGPRAVVDHTLLAVLPATVGGLDVTEFPDAENQAVTDPDLGRNVSRVATAFVGDAKGTNWAYTSVVDVRPEARSDAFYRDWQESFDASACDPAGGVTGHTTIVIAGRDVERTACGAGVRTYHVRIPNSGLLISVSDLGDANFGELELAALRP